MNLTYVQVTDYPNPLTPPTVGWQTCSTSTRAVKKRQEVPFVQDPGLKIKEDLLHKLSRDHQLEGGRERRSGLWGLLGAEESREAPGEATPGRLVRSWGQMP